MLRRYTWAAVLLTAMSCGGDDEMNLSPISPSTITMPADQVGGNVGATGRRSVDRSADARPGVRTRRNEFVGGGRFLGRHLELERGGDATRTSQHP